jgi:hypothetical protein
MIEISPNGHQKQRDRNSSTLVPTVKAFITDKNVAKLPLAWYYYRTTEFLATAARQ